VIIFRRISWKNFLSTGDIPTVFKLDEFSQTLIVGNNGSGKSTLLDAICFGLFGNPYRNINKPNIVNSLNGKGLEVEVDFSIGPNNYRIIRCIKPDKFEIYKNDELMDEDSSVKDYQEKLEQTILKFTHKSFNQIAILGSASHTPFMQLDALKRREVIEELLNIKIFSKMQVLLKKRVNETKKELDRVKLELSIVEEKVRLSLSYIKKCKAEEEESKKEAAGKVKEYQETINDHQKDIDELNEEVNKINVLIEELKPYQEKVPGVVENKRNLDRDISALQKQIDFFEKNENCPTCDQYISAELQESVVSENNTNIAEKQKSLDFMIEVHDTLNEKVNTLNDYISKVRDITSNISRHNSEINMLNVKISTVQENSAKNYSSMINEEQENVKNHRIDFDRLTEEKNELMNQARINDIGTGMLKDTGIKTLVIKQYIHIINTLINKYLSAMDFFVNFTLDETFSETIQSRYRDKFSYSNFSEGEKQKIDLALLFTWRDISRLNNSISTNLLIMDEIFDSSLDQNAAEELAKILFDLSKEVNLYVISHKNDTLSDKFQNIIRFEKVKNFSRMAEQ
jgi:DNA repair exonuclease SbcCD ATPase subunit